MILKRTLLLIGRINVLKMSVIGLSLVVGVPSQAENLGVWGETFEIEEEDLLERILSKLRGLQNNGKLERLSRVCRQINLEYTIMKAIVIID